MTFPPTGGFSSGSFGRASVSGSGLTVNGGFSDSNFRLRFHLGSGFDGVGRFRGFDRFNKRNNNVVVVWSPFAASPFFYNPWWNTSDYGYYPPAEPNMLSQYMPTPSTPAPAAPTPPPVTEHVTPSTAKDLGVTYLSAGDPRSAVISLRGWLRDNAGDTEAMRLLALALVQTGQLSDAAAMMGMAYHSDASLPGKPLAPELFRTAERARDSVRRASVYANRVNSGSAWLLVAVLMQAEGREALASSMVEKARAAGLEADVADRMLAALR
jgi:hypothetical protein